MSDEERARRLDCMVDCLPKLVDIPGHEPQERGYRDCLHGVCQQLTEQELCSLIRNLYPNDRELLADIRFLSAKKRLILILEIRVLGKENIASGAE